MRRPEQSDASRQGFGGHRPASGQAASKPLAEPSELELAETAIYLALVRGAECLPSELRSQIEQTALGRMNEKQD